MGNLQNLLGPFKGILHTDLVGLKMTCEMELPRASKQLRRINRSDGHYKSSAEQHRDDLFQDPSRIGVFVEQYLRDAHRSPLSMAVRTHADGSTSITHDPAEYLPLIRNIVSAPMSVRQNLPPPFDGRAVDPTASMDVRDRGCLPEWWSTVYDRQAKGVPDSTFAHTMRRTTPDEVWSQGVFPAKGGVSPGHDGCDADLWKLITKHDGSSATHPKCLLVLTRFANWCLTLGHVPKYLKHGWITMVPKPRKDGSFTNTAGEMRPITVLPEMGKIISRILASRLSQTLTRPGNLRLLSSAQRGVIRDGSADQCVDTLLDAIEDWHHRKDGSDLFALSYDQSKAYDSVQGYSIRASLERFNMPEIFIRYVLSGLRGATSRVRTAGGLTESFDLQSSVRQGDPLAPLIFALFTDPYHEGLVNNPMVDSSGWGYTFNTTDGEKLRVCSSGYVDDAAALATSTEAVQGMHLWAREFYGAHCSACLKLLKD